MQFFYSSITFYLHSLLKFSAVFWKIERYLSTRICVLTHSSDRKWHSVKRYFANVRSYLAGPSSINFPAYFVSEWFDAHVRASAVRDGVRSANANVLRLQHHFISIKSNWHAAGVYLTKLTAISPSSLNRIYKVLPKVLSIYVTCLPSSLQNVHFCIFDIMIKTNYL